MLPRQAQCQKGNDTPRPPLKRGFSAVDPHRSASNQPSAKELTAVRIRSMKSADSQTIVLSSTTSPRIVPDAPAVPAASSTTAKAFHANRIRHGPTAGDTFRTWPARLTKSRSRGKRMKAVWTLEQGARTRASPAGRPPLPRSPCRREPESNAGITRVAMTPPVRTFHSPNRPCGSRTSADRQWATAQSVTRMRVRKRTGRPSRVAGWNCHVLAAATSIRSW